MEGWVKTYRKILDNPILTKDSDHLAIWIWLLLTATHQPHDALHNGKRITLQPGQLVTGRKKIKEALHIGSESKVERVLTRFENEHQIEQLKCTRNRLITILNWEDYQESEQPNEQQVNNNRTTSEHINKNVRMEECINRKRGFVKPTQEEVSEYIRLKGYHFDAESFIAFYESKGWKIGNQPMKSWKAACTTWEKRGTTYRPVPRRNFNERQYDEADDPYKAFDEMMNKLDSGVSACG